MFEVVLIIFVFLSFSCKLRFSIRTSHSKSMNSMYRYEFILRDVPPII